MFSDAQNNPDGYIVAFQHDENIFFFELLVRIQIWHV